MLTTRSTWRQFSHELNLYWRKSAVREKLETLMFPVSKVQMCGIKVFVEASKTIKERIRHRLFRIASTFWASQLNVGSVRVYLNVTRQDIG